MVSQSKNGKLYIFQKNGFSIKKWKTIYFSKRWFLNQKMENYIFFKRMVSQSKNGKLYIFQKNGFSIKKWKTIYFIEDCAGNHEVVKLYISRKILSIITWFPPYGKQKPDSNIWLQLCTGEIRKRRRS